MPATPHALDIRNEQAVPLSNIATRNVVSLPDWETLGVAARIMTERRISSMLIVDAAIHPIGIVTERNIMHAMQAGNPPDTPLRAVMSAPIISVPEQVASQEAYMLCLREGIRHLALVDEEGLLTGVASETDFRLHMNLTALAGRRPVTSVMTRSVLSLPPSADLLAAVEMMEGHHDSCVVVVDGNRPIGIVTERDVVRLYVREASSAIPRLSEVMAAPVLAVSIDTTVSEAAARMLDARVRHLVVVDPGGELAGLISEHDLTQTMALGLMDVKMDAERVFLRGLIDAIPDLVWLKDPNGVYLACNPPFERRFGARESDIVGKTDYDFVDRELAEALREHDRLAIAKDGNHVDEGWISFAENGQRRLLETINTPMRDPQGRLIGVLGIGHDITERRRMEAVIREKENKYKVLFETANDGIFLLDATGFIDCNQRYAEMYGLGKEALIGRSPADFCPDRQPDGRLSRAVIDEKIRAAFAGEAQVFELQPLRTDGTPFDVEITLNRIEWDGTACLQAIVRDIGKRKSAEQGLRLAASVFTNTHEGIVITDASAGIIEVNEAFTRITGFTREEALGKNPSLLKSGHQGREFYQTMWRVLEADGHWCGEVWNRRKDGTVYAEHLTISAVRGELGAVTQVTHYVGVFADITPFKEHEQRLERIAHYDALTGVPNRVLLSDRMAQATAQTQRSGTLMAVCYLDLDGFKPVNDTYGHEAGDRVLVEMARRMKDCLRGGDTIARIGGDEFVLLLLGMNRMEECESALARILAAIARPVTIADQRITLSASLGITLFPDDDADADTLLRHADQAMYQAKESGKNRYRLFDPEHDRQVKAHQEKQLRLAEALARNEFVLYFQPKVNMNTGEVLGVEALIRWQHPERGLLLPAEFLADLKGTALEVALGEWVIDTTLTQIEVWRRAGHELVVSVNIGADHLLQKDFAERLQVLLGNHPEVSPSSLELEILESTAIADTELASRTLSACRRLGVQFALDDFGTGYSSLTYFRQLPVETLKIDQSFVRNMLDDPEDLSIVESVIQLAQAFKRSVIAEGVETWEHCAALARLRCPVGQGFGIARPMPAERLTDWIAHWREQRMWQSLANMPPPKKREDMVLRTAAESHLKWVDSVAEYLRAPGSVDAPLLPPHQCRFGLWYHGNGGFRYGHMAEFADLDPLHEDIHALAAELTAWVGQGRHADALARVDELYVLRDAFLVGLELLIEADRPDI